MEMQAQVHVVVCTQGTKLNERKSSTEVAFEGPFSNSVSARDVAEQALIDGGFKSSFWSLVHSFHTTISNVFTFCM